MRTSMSGTEASPHTPFDGRYRVLAHAGADPRFEVLRAEPLDGGHSRAIVWFRAPLRVGTPERVAFEAQARALCAFRHRGVAEVHGYGFVSGRPYIVTEGLRGHRLSSSERPNLASGALRILSTVLETFERAHREGLVHGEFGLHQIVLRSDGSAVITGLGLAALAACATGETIDRKRDLEALEAVSAALLGPNTSLVRSPDGTAAKFSPRPAALPSRRGSSRGALTTPARAPSVSPRRLSSVRDGRLVLGFGFDDEPEVHDGLDPLDEPPPLVPAYVAWLDRFVAVGPRAAFTKSETLSRTWNLALTCAVSLLMLTLVLAAGR